MSLNGQTMDFSLSTSYSDHITQETIWIKKEIESDEDGSIKSTHGEFKVEAVHIKNEDVSLDEKSEMLSSCSGEIKKELVDMKTEEIILDDMDADMPSSQSGSGSLNEDVSNNKNIETKPSAVNSYASTQTTQKIGDIIIETNNDQDTSNSRQIVRVRVDNKAAERNRLYRERHREKINQRRRDIRQRKKNSHQTHTLSNIQNINEIEEIIHATSNNQLSHQPSSNSHTQRQQRYYKKNKEEINKRKRDSRLKQNISQSIPATAAERNRKYRERNRQKINERRRDSRLLQRNVQRVHTDAHSIRARTHKKVESGGITA